MAKAMTAVDLARIMLTQDPGEVEFALTRYILDESDVSKRTKMLGVLRQVLLTIEASPEIPVIFQIWESLPMIERYRPVDNLLYLAHRQTVVLGAGILTAANVQASRG